MSENPANIQTGKPVDHELSPRAAFGQARALARDPIVQQMADTITSIWRARRRLANWNGDDRDIRAASMQIDFAWRNLERAGWTVDDSYAGQKYSTGMGEVVTIVSTIPTNDVPDRQIMETLRPAVFYRNIKVRRGEVTVAAPILPIDKEDVGNTHHDKNSADSVGAAETAAARADAGKPQPEGEGEKSRRPSPGKSMIPSTRKGASQPAIRVSTKKNGQAGAKKRASPRKQKPKSRTKKTTNQKSDN